MCYKILIISASEEQFKELENNKFCSVATNTVAITSEAECRAASAKLKLVFAKAWNGPGSFPGCMHCNDGRDTVYWNTSPTPSPIPNRPLYGAICRSASATKRPVPGDNEGKHVCFHQLSSNLFYQFLSSLREAIQNISFSLGAVHK